MMNQEVKNQWIQALRSGKYEQGIGLLRNGSEKFCCLGVLCDIVCPEKWQYNKAYGNYEINNGDYEHDVWTASLPYSLVDKINMDLEEQRNLMKMNDDERANFNQIADYIELNL